MKNRGLRECYAPLSHSLNDKAFVSLNINEQDNNFYLRIPIFSTKGQVEWSYDLMFYLSHDQEDFSSTMYPYGLKDNLCRKFYRINVQNDPNGAIKMVDIDGHVKEFSYQSTDLTSEYKKYINKDSSCAYYFYGEEDYSYCPDNTMAFFHSGGLIQATRVVCTEKDGIYLTNSVDANQHITHISSSSGKFKLVFNYNGNYVSDIYFYILQNSSTDQYILTKRVSFSPYSSNPKEITISYYDYNTSGTAIFQYSITVHFLDSSNIIWIRDNSTDERLTYHFSNSNICDYFYKSGTSYNTMGNIRFELQYSGYCSTIIDPRGNKINVYYDSNQLPYMQVDKNGVAVTIKCDKDSRVPLYTSRSFNIKSNNRINAEENLIENGFFENGFTSWQTSDSVYYIGDVSFSNDYEVLCVHASKIIQVLDYSGIPDEQLFFSCFIWGTIPSTTCSNLNCTARVVLIDYNGNDLEAFYSTSLFKNRDLKPECISFSIKSSYAFSSIRVEIGVDVSEQLFCIGSIQLFKGDISHISKLNADNQLFELQHNGTQKTIVTNGSGQPFIYFDSEKSNIFGDYINETSKLGYKKMSTDYNCSIIKYYETDSRSVYFIVNNTTIYSLTKEYFKGFLTKEKVFNVTDKQYSYNSLFNLIHFNDNVLMSNYYYENNGGGKLISFTFEEISGSEIDTITYSFNAQNILNSFSSEVGTISYFYNSNNLLQSVSLNTTTIVNYLYNNFNNVISKKYGSSTTGYDFVYGNDGELITISYDNSIIHSFLYDDCKRLIQADDYVFEYQNSNIYSSSINGSTVRKYSDSQTNYRIEYDSFTNNKIDYSIHAIDSQYLYMSKNYHFASLFHQSNLSFAVFGLNRYMYESSDDRVYDMFGRLPTYVSEEKVINSNIHIDTFNGKYVIENISSSLDNHGQTIYYRDTICYELPYGYFEDNSGETVGGYFYFNNIDYDYPAYVVYFRIIDDSQSIGLRIEDGYLRLFIVSSNVGYDGDDSIPISANEWYYISLSVLFNQNNKLIKTRIRVNDRVFESNYNPSTSPYSNISNGKRYISFFGANEHIVINSDSTQPIDGYALSFFASPNHKYLSDIEEEDVYKSLKLAFFDETHNDDKSISTSYFAKIVQESAPSNTSKTIVPLCNTFLSFDGQKPIVARHNRELNVYNNSSFRFNVLSNQYSYYACGYDLAYSISNAELDFSISLDIYLDNIASTQKRCIFEIKNSQKSLFVYLLNNIIYCSFNNVEYQLCSLSSIGDNRFSFYYKKTSTTSGIGYYSNNSSSFIEIQTFDGISNGILSLGRKLANEQLVDGTKTCYPLCGFIDSVCFANTSDIDTTRNAYNGLGVVKYNHLKCFGDQKNVFNICSGNQPLSSLTFDCTNNSSENLINVVRKELLELSSGNKTLTKYQYDVGKRLESFKRGPTTNGTTFSSSTVYSFQYDAFSRLIYFNINVSNTPFTYNYDSCGNITLVMQGANNYRSFTYDSLNRITKQDGNINYSYDTSNPFNLKYRGVTLSLNRKAGNNFTYQGRLLTAITTTGPAWNGKLPAMSFTYDFLSRRVAKTANSKKHSYLYLDNKLVFEKITNTSGTITYNKLKFFYDKDGKLLYMEVNDNAKYFYYIDSFNNVVGLYDENGTFKVKYEYDPWGNVLSIQDNSNISLSTLNPFLYKCYYYDHESKMYYCHTRYYVPAWFRWLTIDDISNIKAEAIGGSHLYAYCNNNPVMKRDENGELALSTAIGLAIAGFVLGFSISIVSQGNKYGWDNLDTMSYVEATIAGIFSSITSVLIGADISTIWSVLVGMTGGYINYLFESERDNNNSQVYALNNTFDIALYETASSYVFYALPSPLSSVGTLLADAFLDFIFGLIKR